MRTLLAAFVLICIQHSLIADEPKPNRGEEESGNRLFRALQQLQKEIDDLRREIKRADAPARQMKSQPARNRPSGSPSSTGRTEDTESTVAREDSSVTISRARSDHWSFQPITDQELPTVQTMAWVRDDLDRFILAKLERADLTPNPDATRHELLRRIAFDLTGLPPTVSEIEQFINDPGTPDEAIARAVDRYLDSPRFGERWGRHWLDVVRYADSVGRNWNAPFTYAWRYRDYVIDSFNNDKPYDTFVTEQLAGDLLAANDVATQRERITATGFLALGAMDIIEPEGESLMMDRIDEQIDVTTRALLGLTVACARCHDHKYEPVTMRDYYALAGVFYSTNTKSGQRRGNYVADDDLVLLPSTGGPSTAVPGVHSMADLTREHRSGGWREVLWTTDPNLAMAAIDGRVRDCPVRLDGEAYKRGPAPPRGDFHFAGLSGLGSVKTAQSGRLQFARWITSRDNPLTARVMVNRVWLHLFGRGLVNSVDNFGQSGETPTHPELLDHLATRFVRGSVNSSRPQSALKPWSVKSLIRSIMLSRTYRLSSAGSRAGRETDVSNSLYWRMNIRRLELEAVRDAMLSVAGRISFQRPDGIQVAGVGGKGRWGATRSLLSITSSYRTVYLPVLRSLLPEMYSTFDFPNPTQVKGRREVTTVAQQSLFLMNSDFTASIARAASERVLQEAYSTPAGRLRGVYLRVLGRLPDHDEVEDALNFMSSLSPASTDRDRWSALIQALLISGEFRTLL